MKILTGWHKICSPTSTKKEDNVSYTPSLPRTLHSLAMKSNYAPLSTHLILRKECV